MKKILVGVDGSPESRTAVEQAADLAAATGAQMMIAHVVSPPASLAPDAPYFEQWDVAVREQAGKLVEDTAAECRQRGIIVETATPFGGPAETLASMAARQDIDLVVIGHRGRGAISRVLLGSVADRLVQISPKSVLVSR